MPSKKRKQPLTVELTHTFTRKEMLANLQALGHAAISAETREAANEAAKLMKKLIKGV